METAPIVAVLDALATANVPAAGGHLLGWDVGDLPLLASMPVLLVASGFFSGSETALFSLSAAQRMAIRHRGGLGDRAVAALLADQRMLLVTVLLSNMTINVMYFVVSSVLLMRSTAGGLGQTVAAIVFLLIIILFGEVGPKMLANAARVRFATVCAPLLLTIHRVLGPLRVVISRGVVEPLSRLTAPRAAPPTLADEELRELLEISGREGVIDADEQRMLRDVLGLGRQRVRDVMTPRVRMVALPATATREAVVRTARVHRRTRLPIYGRDLDEILGVLEVKRFLLEPGTTAVTDPDFMSRPRFVPGVATLDHLLQNLRDWDAKSAIVVDEYGGTEGIVAVEDIVEELVGDIVGPNEAADRAPRLVGLGRWLVRGDLDVAAFAKLFGIEPPEASGATIGVLFSERLGRPPVVGDRLEIGPLVLVIESVDGQRVKEITTQLTGAIDPAERPAEDQP